MKLAIDQNMYASDINALKAIDSSTISLHEIRVVGGEEYKYFTLAKEEGIKPNDLSDDDPGRWVKRFNPEQHFTEVDDKYDFAGNNMVDVSGDFTSYMQTPQIYDLADNHVDKDHTSINFITETKDGVSLQEVPTISIDGSVTVINYNINYIDSQNPGTPVVRELFTWDIDETESIPAARTVKERTNKVLEWANRDGSWNTITKSKPNKKYDTTPKRKIEGKRRRGNILAMAQEGAVISLITSGDASTPVQAEEILIEFFEAIAHSITTWKESGKGTIYDDIANDNDPGRTWLNSAHSGSGTIRNYLVEKLKGNV